MSSSVRHLLIENVIICVYWCMDSYVLIYEDKVFLIL